MYILKYTWVGSKRIRNDLQSRCVWAVDVSFQDVEQSVELSSSQKKRKNLKNIFQARLVKFAKSEKPWAKLRIFVPSRFSSSVESPPVSYTWAGCSLYSHSLLFMTLNHQNYYSLKMEMFDQNTCSASTSFQNENIGHKSPRLSWF